jgi:peptidoglycan/LPS O-acetylase OafA/YrhL
VSILAVRFYLLDGSRGIAAFLVYIFHSNNLNNTYVNNFWVFVDFFFCLSGFVLANQVRQSSKSKSAFVEFLCNRFIRLAPVATTSILLMFVLNFDHDYAIRDLAFAFLLIQVLVKKANDINLPLWSTSAEIIINALTPILIILFRFSYLFSLPFIFLLFRTFDATSDTFGTNALARCMIGFALGCFTNQIVNCNKILGLLGIMISLGMIVVFLHNPIQQRWQLIFIDFFFCLFIYGISSLEKSISIWNFCKVICKFLGITSYAVYAFQIPFKVLLDASMFSQFEFNMDQWFLVLFASTRYILLLTFSFYFTKYFDIPIRRYLQAKIVKKTGNM